MREMNVNKVKPVFTESLFSVTKLWNQPKCQLMGKWAQKMYSYLHFWFISHTLSVALPKEENSGFVPKRLNLENVLLNKIKRHRTTKPSLCYLPMESMFKSKPQNNWVQWGLPGDGSEKGKNNLNSQSFSCVRWKHSVSLMSRMDSYIPVFLNT